MHLCLRRTGRNMMTTSEEFWPKYGASRTRGKAGAIQTAWKDPLKRLEMVSTQIRWAPSPLASGSGR